MGIRQKSRGAGVVVTCLEFRQRRGCFCVLEDPTLPPPLAGLAVSAPPRPQRHPQQLTRLHPQRLGGEIEVPEGHRRPAERRHHGNAAGRGASSAAQSGPSRQPLRSELSGGPERRRGASQVRSGLPPRDATCLGIPARTTHSHHSWEACASLSHLAPPRTPSCVPSPAFTRRRGCAGRVAASRA